MGPSWTSWKSTELVDLEFYILRTISQSTAHNSILCNPLTVQPKRHPALPLHQLRVLQTGRKAHFWLLYLGASRSDASWSSSSQIIESTAVSSFGLWGSLLLDKNYGRVCLPTTQSHNYILFKSRKCALPVTIRSTTVKTLNNENWNDEDQKKASSLDFHLLLLLFSLVLHLSWFHWLISSYYCRLLSDP